MKILIYEQRVKKNISLRELSSMTGISKTTLNNHENEKTSPTLEQLEKIAKALNIKMEDLYDSFFK
ncbi:MAG: helix-turn-helix transcriptional regulator [Coprobacillus sp.]